MHPHCLRIHAKQTDSDRKVKGIRVHSNPESVSLSGIAASDKSEHGWVLALCSIRSRVTTRFRFAKTVGYNQMTVAKEVEGGAARFLKG